MNPLWIWLSLGILFLILEILSPSFFFIFLASSAFAVALGNFFLSISLKIQILIFSILIILDILLWWLLFKRLKKNKTEKDEADHLNNRALNLIGRKILLERPIQNGYGRIQIDDTLWSVKGPDLPAGTTIEIIAINGLHLEIKPIDE